MQGFSNGCRLVVTSQLLLIVDILVTGLGNFCLM